MVNQNKSLGPTYSSAVNSLCGLGQTTSTSYEMGSLGPVYLSGPFQGYEDWAGENQKTGSEALGTLRPGAELKNLGSPQLVGGNAGDR